MDKEYYFEKRPVGLFVLLTSLREQPGILKFDNLSHQFNNCGLHVVTDWNYIFLILNRLKGSLDSLSRWEIALDATSFFLFVRIYYDSLSYFIHLLFKAMNPSVSRRWPEAHSFADQVKWFSKRRSDPYFAEYVSCLATHNFEKSFMQMKWIRDRLKTMPIGEETGRLVWASRDWFPITGSLRNEVGYTLYECLKFTDFIGDYFLMKIEEIVSINRMEEDHHGFDRSRLENNQIELYKWFNSISAPDDPGQG